MNINNRMYEIEIIRKRNKNTYIRVNNNKIIVTTGFLTPKYMIMNLLKDNEQAIIKMINRCNKKEEKENNFYYLGNKYDIIIIPTLDRIEMDKDKIYVSGLDALNNWIKKEIVRIFSDRLDIVYNLFEEKIPYPALKIRKMKTRWGVCSKKESITLNSELIKYNLNEIDYVIVHELSHLVYFDHSKNFWALVKKYCPNYKNYRKSLKD